MKRLLAFLAFIPALAFADSISLNMRAVPIVSFAEATYRVILGRDFLITPEVLGMDARLTINMKSVEKEKLPKILAGVLQSVGVRVTEYDGLFRLEKIHAEALPLPAPGSAVLPPGVVNAGPAAVLAGVLPGQEPQDIGHEVYRPQYRTVEYLQAALRFAGLSGGGMMPGGQQAGPALDALVVSGTDEKRQKILKLLGELDQRPQVLNVRAALVEYSNSTSESLSIGGILSLLSGKLSITANASTISANTARWKTGSLDVVLGAMAGDSRFTYRTQPSIRLVDGEQGRLQVGSDVPVRGNLTITQTGQQVQATEYKPSGLVLSVLPRVLRDRVQAKVIQEVSSFTKTNTSGIDSPTLNKRLIETVVDSEDGEIIALAGLDEENITSGHTGLFSWLPLAKSDDKRTTQLLVLLEFKRL